MRTMNSDFRNFVKLKTKSYTNQPYKHGDGDNERRMGRWRLVWRNCLCATSPYDELNKTENEIESSSYRNLILCCCCCWCWCCCYHLRFVVVAASESERTVHLCYTYYRHFAVLAALLQTRYTRWFIPVWFSNLAADLLSFINLCCICMHVFWSSFLLLCFFPILKRTYALHFDWSESSYRFMRPTHCN